MAAEQSERTSRPIALCGFMGVGKSGIGRLLAKALGRPFFDCDAVVVARLGRQIPELFASGEQASFRREEARVIAELLASRPPGVLALGGGALEDPSTLKLLRDQALMVHVDQSWDELRPALESLRRTRPLLLDQSEEQVHELYLARQANYRLAEVTVRTARHGVADATEQVLLAIASIHEAPTAATRPSGRAET